MTIDVHQHFAPPSYIRVVQSLSNLRHGGTDLNRWSIEANLRSLDQNKVDYGIASISAPGVWFGDVQQAADLARIWNDAADGICEQSHGRFGFFGTLPLPSATATIAEAKRLSTSRHLRGFAVFSNYDDVWLGDERYATAFECLDTLHATVLVHPTTSLGGQTLPALRPQILEFPFDTTRTAVSLMQTRLLDRHDKLRLILAHGGGCLAYLADRLDYLDDEVPAGFYADQLSKFYFDTALVSDINIDHLLTRLPAARLVFGSDAPFSEHTAPHNAARFAANAAWVRA